MDRIFSICDKNPLTFITPQGYFQSILKNLLNPMNPFQKDVISYLAKNVKRVVNTMVRNLCKSNSESLKDILSIESEDFKTTQNFAFEYILCYYLNEEFNPHNPNISDNFENAIQIFKFLRRNKITFKYKQKYIKNLFPNKFKKNRKFEENLFNLKQNIILYLASTQQDVDCAKPLKFLMFVQNFLGSDKYLKYLLKSLEFFEMISNSNKFQKNLPAKFISELLNLLSNLKGTDIIHLKIFNNLLNLSEFIEINKEAQKIISEFLLIQIKNFRKPHELGKIQNQFSFSFILDFLKTLKLEEFEQKNEFEEFKRDLGEIYSNLSFGKSQKKPEIRKPIFDESKIDYFILSKKDLDDKRFHYEDNLVGGVKIEEDKKFKNFDFKTVHPQ